MAVFLPILGQFLIVWHTSSVIDCCSAGQNSCSLLAYNQVAVVLLPAKLSIQICFCFVCFVCLCFPSCHFQASAGEKQKDRLRTRLLFFTKTTKSVCRPSIGMHVSLRLDIRTPDVEETVVTSLLYLITAIPEVCRNLRTELSLTLQYCWWSYIPSAAP